MVRIEHFAAIERKRHAQHLPHVVVVFDHQEAARAARGDALGCARFRGEWLQRFGRR